MAKIKFWITLFIIHSLFCPVISTDQSCGSPFPVKGHQIPPVQDFYDCYPLKASLWLPNIGFCRDRCLRASWGCKSFSFNCDSFKTNVCKLFNVSYTELMPLAGRGICKSYVPSATCIHENTPARYIIDGENCKRKNARLNKKATTAS